jgi:pimeloyl-ACP methyl ester carboxylesterase
MKKKLLIAVGTLITWCLVAQTPLFKNRWTDKKAYRIFKAKNIPLQIFDTLIDEQHIHYAVSGNDSLPTLVFIHGSPGSWMNYATYMWDAELRKKFRMVSIDRPGFGFSNFGEALHLQAQCHYIMPVLKKLKTNQPMILFGHSLGGPIVVQLAAMEPTMFSTIAVVSGSIAAEYEKKENWRKVMNVDPFYALLPGAFGPSNTEIIYLKDDLKLLAPEFEKITCKVHFIHGNKDTWVPIENVGYGISKLKNARQVNSDTIFGARHMLPWKNEKVLKALILKLE